MPQMTITYTLDIKLEKFVAQCSDVELQELYLLIDSEIRRRERLQDIKYPSPKLFNPSQEETTQAVRRLVEQTQKNDGK